MSDQPKKILVADDDADQREALQTILETQDYAVVTAENEDETMKRIEEEQPDLLLLDVMMAHLDGGFAVCQKLKSNPATKNMPIIMVTSIRQEMNVDYSPDTDGGYLPADAFLEKPVSPEKLLAEVGKLLGG